MSREMTIDEIEGLIAAMARSAFIAREGGFDGIELHGHEGYLLDQFKSALWNKRTDAYGGELAGRMTFSLSIIRKIREAAGYDFPFRTGTDLSIESMGDGKRRKACRSLKCWNERAFRPCMSTSDVMKTGTGRTRPNTNPLGAWSTPPAPSRK